MRDEWGVRRNNHDDRAVVLVYEGSAGVRISSDNLSANRNPCNAQIVFRAVVALHKNSDRISAIFRVELARSRADSSLESIADHSRATADVAFLDGAGCCGIYGVQSVLRLHVESVDVIEPAVPRFRDDRQLPPVTCALRLTMIDSPLNDGIAN